MDHALGAPDLTQIPRLPLSHGTQFITYIRTYIHTVSTIHSFRNEISQLALQKYFTKTRVDPSALAITSPLHPPSKDPSR